MVVQSVGTDGRVFQFLVLQLNTTDLASSEGIKNLVWVDSDQLLYRHFWCRPVIKKKVVVVSPASSSLVITAGLDLSIQREPRLGLSGRRGSGNRTPTSACPSLQFLLWETDCPCVHPHQHQCRGGPCYGTVTLLPGG